MEGNIINSGTITYAIRGRDTLRNKGYKAYMFRNKSLNTSGCGYSISTNCPTSEIIKIFNEEKIKYLSVSAGDWA